MPIHLSDEEIEVLLDSNDNLGSRLVIARDNLQKLVEECIQTLQEPHYVPMAKGVATAHGGDSLKVLANGQIEVSTPYVPRLATLRAEAKAMGVDISHLGRKVKAIRAFLDEVKERGHVGPDEVMEHKGFAKTGTPVRIHSIHST